MALEVVTTTTYSTMIHYVLSGKYRMQAHHIIEGELYFGDDVSSVSTLLGSCVAVIVWHPILKVGGMCHIVLPGQDKINGCNKYAYDAIATITQHTKQIDTNPRDYRTCVYGGGEMFAINRTVKKSVGSRNIEAVNRNLAKHGYRIYNKDTGGKCYRKIKLIIQTGEIIVNATDIDEARLEVAGWKK
ncbi:MAG: chemotaxis protein CheD [Thiohalomonadales bacterium]